MTLDEYRKKYGNPTLDKLAEYYDEITYDIVNELFIVEKGGKLNFIYETKLEFTPVIYDFCHLYPGFAVVRKGNQVGNLFFHEGLAEPSSYRTVNIFEVKRGNYFGIETDTGDIILACKFLFVKIYPNFIIAFLDDKFFQLRGYLLFFLDGRRMFDFCFDDIDIIYMQFNNWIYVQKDKRWGVINTSGHWIVTAIFLYREDIDMSEYYNIQILTENFYYYDPHIRNSQNTQSSCCDFFKIPPDYIKELGDEQAGIEDDGSVIKILKSYKVNYKKAIRWYLIYSVLDDNLCDWYFNYFSKKFKKLTIKKSDELLSLFKVKNIRTNRYGFTDNLFLSTFNLANDYFKGNKVKINYEYAFELYSHCHYMFTLDDFEYDESLNKWEYAYNYDFTKQNHIVKRLFWMYCTGNGVKKDKVRGKELLNKFIQVIKLFKTGNLYFENGKPIDLPFPLEKNIYPF